MYNKKAAMFGLDARIALAIFGALSVISGAALYSSIQKSKVTAIITELNEISKAWEQYYLDTGSRLELKNTKYLNELFLLNSTKVGWSGPYIQSVDHPIYRSIGLVEVQNAGYSTGNDALNNACTAGNECNVFVSINGIPQELAEEVDLEVDGVAGITDGNIRLTYGFTGASEIYNTGVMLKVYTYIK